MTIITWASEESSVSKGKYRQLELIAADVADPFLEDIIWGAIPLSALSPDERTLFWESASPHRILHETVVDRDKSKDGRRR